MNAPNETRHLTALQEQLELWEKYEVAAFLK